MQILAKARDILPFIQPLPWQAPCACEVEELALPPAASQVFLLLLTLGREQRGAAGAAVPCWSLSPGQGTPQALWTSRLGLSRQTCTAPACMNVGRGAVLGARDLLELSWPGQGVLYR